MTHTTLVRRRNLQRYLEQLRDLMRLQAWDVEVLATPAYDEEALLETDPDPRRHWAPIRVGTFFEAGNDADEQRQTCVHELIHVVQADLLHWAIVGGWRLPLAPDAARAIEEGVRSRLEVQADFLARLIAPSMPAVPEDWDA